MKTQLNELALFAGAGGGILGGKLLGWRTVCAVEWDGYARDVLVARQNDGCLEAFPIWDDVQTFDGNPWRGIVDVVSGGFPCQDISCAGKGAGIDGERSGMWKHMARIIGEVRPQYAFVENSPMLVGRGLAIVLADLAEMGYDTEWGIVGAHHVSAPHRRDRIWILASHSSQLFSHVSEHNPEISLGGESISKLRNNSRKDDVSDSNLCGCDDGGDSQRQHQADYAQVGEVTEDQQSGSVGQHRTSSHGCDVANATSQGLEGEQRQKPQGFRVGFANKSQDVANTDSQRFTQLHNASQSVNKGQSSRCVIKRGIETEWWASEPNVGGKADGMATKLDGGKAHD